MPYGHPYRENTGSEDSSRQEARRNSASQGDGTPNKSWESELDAAVEEIVAADYWPVPTYDDILFYV